MIDTSSDVGSKDSKWRKPPAGHILARHATLIPRCTFHPCHARFYSNIYLVYETN